MNIQIFGIKNCNDTRKALRFFKERNIKFQFINLIEKEISKRELRSISQSVGGLSFVVDKKSTDKDLLLLLEYMPDSQQEAKILDNQRIIKTPIVRNGKNSTIGYMPETWKEWS